MQEQQIVDIEDASHAQALEQAYQGAEQFGTDSGGLRHAKAHGFPLHAATRTRVPKPAIFSLRRMQPHGEVTIREVDQHTKIVSLDAVGDRL